MARVMRNGSARTVFDVRFHGDVPASFRAQAAFYPVEMAKAVGQTAYRAQLRLKAEMLQRVPGGKKIEDISQMQKFRIIDAFKRVNFVTDRYGHVLRDENGNPRRKYARPRRGSAFNIPYYSRAWESFGSGLAYRMNGTNWPIGGKLAQIITYRHKKGSLTASVGWDKYTKGVNAARMALLWQKGQTTLVTPAMRRLFYYSGVSLAKGKTHLIQPPRPVLWYFFEGRKKWMAAMMWDRMRTLVNESSARTTRKFANRVIHRGIF